MGILNSIRTSVHSHDVPLFKQKDVSSTGVTREKELTPELTPPTLMSPYAPNKIPDDTLNVANPIIVLLQAQATKGYFEWEFNTASDMVWQIAFREAPASYAVVEKLMLVGTDLMIESRDIGIFKVNLVDEFGDIGNSNVELMGQTLSVKYGALFLTCTKDEALKQFTKCCLLSIFEYDSLYKSLTGAIISTFGLRMSDMHVVLNSSFNFKDWCEIYLEDEGWVKVWCHIDKPSKKTSSHEHRKGNHQIKFYRNNKSKSSKNLLCFVPDCAYVQDIFFYKDCMKADKPSTEKSMVDFLNSTKTIKIVGNVSFPLEGFSKKNRSTSSSSMSFFSKSETRDRSNSSSSAQTCASPTGSRSPTLRMFSPSKRHQRSPSQASADSIYSTYKDLDNCAISSKGLLVRPVAHNGVNHLESLIRFVIPMLDCMRLYGRPNRFRTERADAKSLMFGLPKLPTVDYFAIEEMQDLMNPERDIDFTNSNDGSAVAMHWFSSYLGQMMLEDSTRRNDLTFKTLADLPQNNDDSYSFIEKGGGSVSTNSSPLV